MSISTDTPTFAKKIERLFFAEEVPYGFALMRIILPLVLLEGWTARWRFSEELYSTNGVNIALFENFGYYNYLQPLPPFWTACLMSVLILSLVTSMLGWFTRFSLITSLVLHVYFASNDMAATTTKFTVVSAHALLMLGLSGCGRIWSIDSWLAGRRDPHRAPLSERPAGALAARWPQVLLMLMIGASYLGAAITKLHMPDFVTGDAITYWIMSNPNFRHSIGEWMTQHPGLLVISGQFTVLWEVLFPFLAWKGLPRKFMFGLGLFFHITAALTLGEVTFLMVISSCYLGCLLEGEVLACANVLQRIRSVVFSQVPKLRFPVQISTLPLVSRLPVLSPRFQSAMLAVAVLTVGLGGAWVHQRMDLYGTNRPEGPYELTPIEPDEAARLFAAAPPLREVDKYLGIRLGSLKIGGRLSNHCDKFRQNDMLICEASLNPPHEDMWMECHVLSDDRKLVHRDGIVVPSEARWAQFSVKLTDVLEPGQYSLVIRSRGQEICRRPFTLEAGVKAPVAN